MNQPQQPTTQKETNRQGFYLIENIEQDLVDVYINGEFRSVEEHADFLEKLRIASSELGTARFFISSSGGNVGTCNHIIELMHRFDFTVSVCLSYMASAGVIIWAEADYKVVSPNAMVMIHRESFMHFGKVEPSEHLTQAIKYIGERLFEKSAEFLNEEEIARAKLSEVYFDGNTLLQRKFCVSYAEYMDRLNPIKPVGTVVVNPNTNRLGLITPQGTHVITDIHLDIDSDPIIQTQYEWLLGSRTPVDSDEQESENQQEIEETEEKTESLLQRIKTIFKLK